MDLHYVVDEAYTHRESFKSPHLPTMEIKCGKKIITLLGMLIGFACAVIVLLKDRKFVSHTGVVLITFLSLFIVFSIMFITMSVLLLLATVDHNTELMSHYTWYSMICLCIQLVVALSIPVILVIDERPITPIILTWLIIVLIVGLGWTHFVAVVESYRMELVNIISI